MRQRARKNVEDWPLQIPTPQSGAWLDTKVTLQEGQVQRCCYSRTSVLDIPAHADAKVKKSQRGHVPTVLSIST